MKLYQTPGGTWAGTDKDWSAAMKAEGLDPKHHDGRKIVEVPTSKAELMEFLTFHNVNVVSPRPALEIAGSTAPPPPGPVSPVVCESSTTMPTLDELFAAAPISQRLRLAVTAIDAADDQIRRV